MAGEAEIPEDIRQLIVDSIDSVAHLEAILLLRGDPAEEWSAETVAKRLYITPTEAANVLAGLSEQGVLATNRQKPPAYRYSPHSPDLAQLIDRLAETYRQRLIAVTNLIHAPKPNRNVRRFSDAFRLRRDG